MPRYESPEGTSNKFWEIELAGAKYSCKWGRIWCGDPDRDRSVDHGYLFEGFPRR